MVHVGIEEGRCVRGLSEFLVEFVEHVAQQNFDVEVSLYSVNDVNPVEVAFLVEPAMRDRRLEDDGNRKLPDPNVIRYEVKHRTQVLLAPVVLELLEDP